MLIAHKGDPCWVSHYQASKNDVTGGHVKHVTRYDVTSAFKQREEVLNHFKNFLSPIKALGTNFKMFLINFRYFMNHYVYIIQDF